jgi:pyruvate dehydrogenase E1 component beta subunit
MSEEMSRWVHILMGEEVAEYNGAYKASKGMLAEFVKKEWLIPYCRAWFYWYCSGISAMNGCTNCRIHDFNFCLVGIDQIINNAAKMRQMTGGQFNVPIVFVDQQLQQDN